MSATAEEKRRQGKRLPIGEEGVEKWKRRRRKGGREG
jgi:hypothetical protein